MDGVEISGDSGSGSGKEKKSTDIHKAQTVQY